MTLHIQLITMITMIIGGVYLGFATETFRRISNIWRNNVYLTYILEITFWVVQTCLLFFVLYNVNNAEMRIYIFLACLLGFSIYTVLFKAMYKRLLEIIINVVKHTIKWIIQIINVLIVQPIMWIIHIVGVIILYILNLFRHILLFLLKLLLYPIRFILPKKIYNKITNVPAFCSTIIYKLKNRIKHMFFRR